MTTAKQVNAVLRSKRSERHSPKQEDADAVWAKAEEQPPTEENTMCQTFEAAWVAHCEQNPGSFYENKEPVPSIIEKLRARVKSGELKMPPKPVDE